MATGFMNWLRVLAAVHISVGTLACLPQACAADVQVIALTAGKATLVIDGGRPRTLSAGQSTPEGVRLVSASAQSAVVEIAGVRHNLALGSSYRVAPVAPDSGPLGQSVTLTADGRGHFVVSGQVNGTASIRFLVDTGASMVSISSDDATRAGINYLAGERAFSQTASGVTPIYRVKLDSIRIGDIVLYNVDAAVHVSGRLPIALLGMSFLNRMEMRHGGGSLVLTRRF